MENLVKKWLDFERLIARIYKCISPNATVVHNDKIPGHKTGTDRQIDVSIRFREAGCDFLVIVQAKTNANPLDINAIGEFASVVEDVRATKGVLICNSGFTEKALVYARNIGIDLCSAHDAESKNWRTILKLPVVWVRLSTSIRCEMILELEHGDTISTEFLKWRFSGNDGRNAFSVWDQFQESWNSHTLSMEPGKPHDFAIGHDELRFLAGEAWRPVCEVSFTYMVERMVLRNEVETQDFTGIRNLLTDNLEFAHLGVSIPPRMPEYGWTAIGPEEERIISMKPAIVTVEAPPPIQHAISDPVKSKTLSNIGNVMDSAHSAIRIRRKNRGKIVSQTMNPLIRQIEFAEILAP